MKFTLYRIIFNLSLGIIGIEIFHNIFFTKGFFITICGNGIQFSCSYITKLKSNIIFLYFIIAILMGEIIALLGEAILNIFLNYNPLRINTNIEKISPYIQEYISYIDFKNFIINEPKKELKEIFEIHFVLSRILSGLGFLSLVFGICFDIFYNINYFYG